MDERDLIEPTEDERRNGWTAETLTEYIRTNERYFQARYFKGSYGDPDLDQHMEKMRRAEGMTIESSASYDPMKW